MLFDINPKEKVSDLYDRKKELADLSQAIRNNERLSIIFGVRRVGKTSLIHAFLSEHEIPYILVDARQIYTSHSSIPAAVLYQLIGNGFVDFVERMHLDTQEGLESKYPRMFSGIELTELLKGINRWCADKKLKYAIVFDEAQYLRFGGSVKYDMLLAWSIDNLSNIFYVLTGSEVGMLRDFLNYQDADAPLYGRFRNEIYLGKFNDKSGEGFLSSGFRELNVNVNRGEIEEAVKRLGGVAGWLTYYGHFRGVKGMGQEEALKSVFDEGSRIVIKEINGLISHSRNRYLAVLRLLSEGPSTWTGIKSYVTAKNGIISDTRLNALMQNLVKFGIVEKSKSDTYSIIDPVTVAAIKRIRPYKGSIVK